jgi:hypothetical protein
MGTTWLSPGAVPKENVTDCTRVSRVAPGTLKIHSTGTDAVPYMNGLCVSWYPDAFVPTIEELAEEYIPVPLSAGPMMVFVGADPPAARSSSAMVLPLPFKAQPGATLAAVVKVPLVLSIVNWVPPLEDKLTVPWVPWLIRSLSRSGPVRR